ncbi:restriction endonuclease subunit S, partial [Thermococcus sp.]|uniref:restriction endonuclease subunit S n=1 Tax=Thermococcus sp. TaxID=35749 RepID=UPI00262856A4
MKEKPLTEFMDRAKNKKEKPAPKASGLKGPWELPEGWKWVRLEEIAKIIMGQSPPSDSYNTEGVGFPFYQGSKDFGLMYPTPKVWCTKPQKIAEKGDILISVRAPVGPVNIANEKCIIGRGLAAIRPLNIERMFLFYFLKSYEPRWTGFGSTFDAIRKKELQKLLVPLPPLSEQKLIVKKLDEVSKRLEEAKRLAREARKEAEKLMASALHEVFSKAEERGWEWVKLGDVAKDMKPGFARNKKHISEDGIPHLR